MRRALVSSLHCLFQRYTPREQSAQRPAQDTSRNADTSGCSHRLVGSRAVQCSHRRTWLSVLFIEVGEMIGDLVLIKAFVQISHRRVLATERVSRFLYKDSVEEFTLRCPRILDALRHIRSIFIPVGDDKAPTFCTT